MPPQGIESMKQKDIRNATLAELSPRLQMQMNQGVSVSASPRAMGRSSALPEPPPAAEVPPLDLRGTTGSIGSSSSVIRPTPSQAATAYREENSDVWRREEDLEQSPGRVEESIQAMESFLEGALSSHTMMAPEAQNSVGSQLGRPQLQAQKSLLSVLGLQSSSLRGMGMGDNQIERLYHGLYGQATAFQQLVDSLVVSQSGPGSDMQIQLLGSFHEVAHKLLEAQETELRVLHDIHLPRQSSQQSSVGAPLAGEPGWVAEATGRAMGYGLDAAADTQPPLEYFGRELTTALSQQGNFEARCEVLHKTLITAKQALEELEGDNQILQSENDELRQVETKVMEEFNSLKGQLESKAGEATGEADSLKEANKAYKAEVSKLRVELKKITRELEEERVDLRHANRDKAKAEEWMQKYKEEGKSHEFSIRMLDSQLKELSNSHCRKLEDQQIRFKKDMDDYVESRRRRRALEADLSAMRQLYLDETSLHTSTKTAWEEDKEAWEVKVDEFKQTIAELEAAVVDHEALKADKAKADKSIAELKGQNEELSQSVEDTEAIRKQFAGTITKTNMARAEAEHVRGQARVHIEHLYKQLELARRDLKYAMETLTGERAAKNSYRLKQDALQDKIRAEQGHIESLLEQLEHNYRRAARADAQREAMMKDVAGLEERVRQLTKQRNDVQEVFEAEQRNSAQLASQIDLEQKRVQDREEEVRRVQEQLNSKSGVVKSLQLEVQELAALQQEMERTRKELARVTSSFALTSSEYNVVHKKLINAEGQVTQLNFQVELAQTHLKALQREVNTVQAENQELGTAKGKLQADLDASKSRATERMLHITYLKSQVKEMKDGHERATEELSEKRTAASELELLNEGMTTELADVKKRLLDATTTKDSALKLRDNLRQELQVYKKHVSTIFNGLEGTLFSLEAERSELTELHTSLGASLQKVTDHMEDLVARNPHLEEARAVLLSLQDIGSEAGVARRMMVLEGPKQKELREAVVGNERDMQRQLVEAQIAAQASRVGGSGAQEAGDESDITYLRVSKADLDKQAAMLVAAEQDLARERERANREQARRESALADLERGLKEVSHQRDLLGQKEEMWKADLRRMENDVQAHATQVKMRETYSEKLAARCKELEVLLAKYRKRGPLTEENSAAGAGGQTAKAESTSTVSIAAPIVVPSETSAPSGDFAGAGAMEASRPVPPHVAHDQDETSELIDSQARALESFRAKIIAEQSAAAGVCPHCGGAGGGRAVFPGTGLSPAGGDGAAASATPYLDEPNPFLSLVSVYTQTDHAELWMRNHDAIQVAAFDDTRYRWMQDLEAEDTTFAQLTLEKVLQSIRICYEAKAKADAAAVRDARELPELYDVVYSLYLQRYGALEMATESLVALASSVRSYSVKSREVALFGLTCQILREKDLSGEMLSQLPLLPAEGGGEGKKWAEEKTKSATVALQTSPRKLTARYPVMKPELPDEARGRRAARPSTSQGTLEQVNIWTLLEEVGLGLGGGDNDRLLGPHAEAWQSVATHLSSQAPRLLSKRRPEPESFVHQLLPWIVPLAMGSAGMPALLSLPNTYDFQADLRTIDLGVPVTSLHVPHLWYLLYQICELLRLGTMPELYLRYGEKPMVYFLEMAPLVKLEPELGSNSPVPWQRLPVLVVSSAALRLLNPSELQAAMACALGPHLSPGGGGYSVHTAHKLHPRLAEIASIATIAELAPELLKAAVPASLALTWETGLGQTLAKVREYIQLCGDRAAGLAVQDLRIVAQGILKVSAGTASLSGSLNPDAILEEARQTDTAALTLSSSKTLGLDLVSALSSMAVLRIRELDKFMSSDVYSNTFKGSAPLSNVLTVSSSVRFPTAPTSTRPGFKAGDFEVGMEEIAGGMMSKKLRSLRNLHQTATAPQQVVARQITTPERAAQEVDNPEKVRESARDALQLAANANAWNLPYK